MQSVRQLLDQFFEVKKSLQKCGVIRSERFTGDLGEWLVATAYKGRLASSATQIGWDVEATIVGNNFKLQVKTHAKGKNNNARWSAIKKESLERELFDYLIIVVMSDDYFIQDWFEIPRSSLKNILVQSGNSWIVRWDSIESYRANWKGLPGAAAILEFESKRTTAT